MSFSPGTYGPEPAAALQKGRGFHFGGRVGYKWGRGGPFGRVKRFRVTLQRGEDAEGFLDSAALRSE